MAVVCALGNNKRRLSAGVAAAPQRHPLATLAGADQAHTQTKRLTQNNRVHKKYRITFWEEERQRRNMANRRKTACLKEKLAATSGRRAFALTRLQIAPSLPLALFGAALRF